MTVSLLSPKNICNIIDQNTLKFEPISLQDIGKVEFMNRVDHKYIFPVTLLPEILNQSSHRYKILQIDEFRTFDYLTTYFDTSNLHMFWHHIHGKLNRYKVRHRSYLSTGDTFLEIKEKTNKNRTIKHRIKSKFIDVNNDKCSNFLLKYSPYQYSDLIPVLNNNFTRITLICNQSMERITLDYNLNFSIINEPALCLPFLAIAEIKSNKSNIHSGFSTILKNLGLRSSGFSKYCCGYALTRNIVPNCMKM